MAGATSAGAQNDVHTLRLKLSCDLRSRLILELLNVSAAAHEGIGLFRQRANIAFFYQLAKSVNREHGIDILVDIGVVKSAVGNHELL